MEVQFLQVGLGQGHNPTEIHQQLLGYSTHEIHSHILMLFQNNYVGCVPRTNDYGAWNAPYDMVLLI